MLVGSRGRKTSGNQGEGREGRLTCYKSKKQVGVRIAAVGRRSRETHKLSDQAARRKLANRQGGEGSRRGNSHAVRSGRQANVSEQAARRGMQKGISLAVKSGHQANVSEPAARRGIRGENSHAVRSSRQANVSEPVAQRGIRKGELTSCEIRPPGER